MCYMCAERNKLRRVFSTAIDLVKAGLSCIQDTLSSRATLGLPAAFRPSVSREQRYLAYKGLSTAAE